MQMFRFDPVTGDWLVVTYNGQDYDLRVLHKDGTDGYIGSGTLDYISLKIDAVLMRSSVRHSVESLRAIKPVGRS